MKSFFGNFLNNYTASFSKYCTAQLSNSANSSFLTWYQDPRLDNGYENVPTVDIHMKQIGYDDEWLYFLKVYASPLQQKVFIGYNHAVNTVVN